MDDVTRHPDDERLFDYVAGSLDSAVADLVARHLQRCSACAGFVRAAGTGTESLAGLVEPMPDTLATDMHRALAAAWRDRRDSIAAHEAAVDAAAPVPAEAGTGRLDTTSQPVADVVRPARSGRWRRLVPVLAFVVLATLAGTSIYLGGDQAAVDDARSGDDTGSFAADEDVPAASAPAPSNVEAERAESADAAGAAGATADLAITSPESGATSPTDEAGDRTAKSAAGDDAAFEVPPVGVPGEQVDAVAMECIFTRDETGLTLPGGRLAASITRGPFDLYLVCG